MNIFLRNISPDDIVSVNYEDGQSIIAQADKLIPSSLIAKPI